MKKTKDELIAKGIKAAPSDLLEKYRCEYDRILEEALTQNPNSSKDGKRKPKRGKTGALVDRLILRKEEYGLLNEALGATETELSVTKVRKTPIVLGDKAKYHDNTDFLDEFLRFCREQRKSKLNLSLPIGGYFKNMDTFLKNPSQPTRFLSVDPKGEDVIPKGLYLIGYTRGYYGVTNDLPERMDDFAKKERAYL